MQRNEKGMNVERWIWNKYRGMKREWMQRNEKGMNVLGLKENKWVNIKVLLLRIPKKLSLILKPWREVNYT